jgi:hypothetical protein
MYANDEKYEDRKSSTTIMKMNEHLKVKYDDEYLSNEDNFQRLQQKNFINVLLNGRENQFED